MIEFIKNDRALILRYKANRFTGDAHWIDNKIKNEGSVTLRKTFTFRKEDTLDTQPINSDQNIELEAEDDDTRDFTLGTKHKGYYKIKKEILDLKYDLLIDTNLPIDQGFFIANRDISIFRKIDEQAKDQIIIGNENENAIPTADFFQLIKTFPTTTELNHYANSRIQRVLKDYLGTISDAQKKLESYLSKKKITPRPKTNQLREYELKKFEFIRDELKSMLSEPDSYSERNWQDAIVEFLLIIFPKYVSVLNNLKISDYYSSPNRTTNRYIDITLVDCNGNIDIIEIKKPFSNCLLSTRKYRDNYTPKSELSGSVMQTEKYIFHLNKWGRAGELEITKSRKSELPKDLEVRITNPKGIIILGRDNEFTHEQKFDFEIIRRKYGNIMDIMTYDDLLRRLENIISMILQKS
ncbi:DUF4263 domain-containing protein [Pseudomonas sp. BN411]|uniref:Shedu immune nuclease family protein n=1 Tax=Pseudomonas sp. BN411 TaxID=2567887 RepID=UPI0024560C45|nr:DUF4263 domain-containing protein [Pseudomonas sp. BN411]MDH4560783.1 DUF4263 domain-containing protein [Pseudomonas sp. BN411]